ncbi:MAG: L,D-transpeptidase family protein, partial [Steroidobacteraceae bacterium]
MDGKSTASHGALLLIALLALPGEPARGAPALAAATLPAANAAAAPATTPASAPAPAPAPVIADALVEMLRERTEALAAGASVSVDGQALKATRTLPQLYRFGGFQPLWDVRRLRSLLELISDVEDDGLLPADYHRDTLERYVAQPALDAAARLRLELLASDAYALILYHLYFGKVDPVALDAQWNFERRSIGERDAVRFVYEAITQNRVRASVAQVRPDHPLYRFGRDALAQYRGIAALGGWPTVPAGPTLKPGDRDPRVAVLRERLAVSGDLAPPPQAAAGADPLLFDAPLAAALQHFQRRHRLTDDGALGKGTLQALNVPVERRIAQIRANLERGRWVLHELNGEGPLVVVDIAGFAVRWLRDGREEWRTRAVVGKPFRQTPVFKSAIDHVVFNPTWTVPPTVLRQDVLPGVRKDPRYLDKHGLRVLDRNGQPVDPASVDFTARSFPYTLRQDAGKDNALGAVKIMFPNPYSVYLHDTPSKSLFERDQRTFSSGCIRTERPLELVERLLADPQRWNRAAIDAVVAQGET